MSVQQQRARELITSSCIVSPPGTLPTEWSRQPRLAVVDVSHNRLAGTLPDAWGGGALPALDTVDASGNGGIGGTLPESWGALPLLRVL
jgi:hypothetical protein